MKNHLKNTVATTLLSATALAGLAIATPAPASAGSNSSGGATISGKSWLKGKGVPVFRSRTCVDVATRLYSAKGWGSLNNIYSKNPPDKRIQFIRPGIGYRPVPGDVVIEGGGSYGHIGVVDRVVGNRIHTVEQNASAGGRKTYTLRGPKLRAYGAYGSRYVQGFLHAKKNK